MEQLVQEAIQALTDLDAAQLDKLLGELAVYQMSPPSHAALQAALPGQRVLGALLRETERNLRLLQRSSPCETSRIAMGADVYPAAWRSEQ